MDGGNSDTPSAAAMDSREVERVFNRFDENSDGKISADELGKVVRAIGSDVSDQEVGVMIQEMDSDRDGLVDLKEFADFHTGSAAPAPAAASEALRDAFGMYDTNGDGKISAKELHLLLKKLGEKCGVEDCGRMIKMVDADGDGFVSFDEFKSMMMRGGAVKE